LQPLPAENISYRCLRNYMRMQLKLTNVNYVQETKYAKTLAMNQEVCPGLLPSEFSQHLRGMRIIMSGRTVTRETFWKLFLRMVAPASEVRW